MGEGPLLRPVLPENTEFVILSFEGPDPYSNAGGLGVRVTELSRALADAGFRTHLFFIGDPEKPPIEAGGGRLILRRWGQWISRYYPNGVYQGEKQKLYDFHSSVPGVIADEVGHGVHQVAGDPGVAQHAEVDGDLHGVCSPEGSRRVFACWVSLPGGQGSRLK